MWTKLGTNNTICSEHITKSFSQLWLVRGVDTFMGTIYCSPPPPPPPAIIIQKGEMEMDAGVASYREVL